MDFSSLNWPSILVGFVLSILGGFIASLIRRYLERSKIYVSKRRKKSALRDLELINGFQMDSTRAVLWAAGRIIFVIVMTGTMVGFVVARFFGEPFTGDSFFQSGMTPYKIFATLNSFVVLWYVFGISRVINRYNNFGDFILQLKTNFDIDAIAFAKSHTGETTLHK